VLRARAASTEYIESESKRLFGEQPVDAIYLDCVLINSADSQRGRFALVPRNELPFFLGPEMNNYTVAQVYHICPFYFATNAPRQEAGVARTTIVKLVRKIDAQPGRAAVPAGRPP
jgi:hypothetical protein